MLATHLIEFIDAANALIAQDQGTGLQRVLIAVGLGIFG